MKKAIGLIVVCMAFLLSGCSTKDNSLINNSMLGDDANYQQFQEYRDSGLLDSEGYYLDEKPDDVSKDTVHISFSNNAYLDIDYFLDGTFQTKIGTEVCRLNVGDCIFAKVTVNNPKSSAYRFSGFRISEINEERQRTTIYTVAPADDGLLLKITAEMIGKELAIDPIGEYSKQQLVLKDSYLDNNESEHSLSGKWIVDDKVVGNQIIEINPVSSHIISYEFDADNYFFLSSEPECFYSNSEDGIVIFNKREAAEQNVNYSVKLHEYINVNIISYQDRKISVNNEKEQEIKENSELEISKLRYGDKVIITSDTQWDELENLNDLVLLSTESNNGKAPFKYTLNVPEKGAEFAFDPADYSYEHGTITFTYRGEVVTSVIYLAPGRIISYSEDSIDDGWCLPAGEHYIEVTTQENTKKTLEQIHFIPKVKVTVNLPQPQYGGKIKYSVDGEEITTTSYTCNSGSQITANVVPWEGWISTDYSFVYTATADSNQTACKDADKLISEDANHKPNLTVILDKSLGKNMGFIVSAHGFPEKSYQYEDHALNFNGRKTVIDEIPIGTGCGISIAVNNRAIQSGTAVKLLIEKEGQDKSTAKNTKVNTSEVVFINDASQEQTIDIYSKDENGTSNIWYSAIKITASLEDVSAFKEPISRDNITVTVQCEDDNKPLREGDLFVKGEKATVTICPDNGYYLLGKSVKNDVYSTTVKLDDKYVSEINSIIEKHPTEKYITVVLANNDSYGWCEYELEGNPVSGKVQAKKGDTISIDYKITDESYVINGEKGRKKTHKTAKIEINESHDGKILSKESFGIQVRKGA